MGILSTKRILVTQIEGRDSALLPGLLASAGAQVETLPLLKIEGRPFDLPDLAVYDWLFFTSQEGVRHFVEPWLQKHPEFHPESWPPIAVVGASTARLLQDWDLSPAFIPPQYDAASAAQTFVEQFDAKGLRLLWPCGNLAQPVLRERFVSAGAEVDTLVVYQTLSLEVASLKRQREERFTGQPIDVVTFASPSAVKTFHSLGPLLDQTLIACIGPSTASCAQQYFGRAEIQAEPHTLEGLGRAIERYFSEPER